MIGDNMLEKFSVENYKKFKDKVEIDFTKTHDYKFSDSCIRDGIITKSVMFGNNASGKSSFGFALFDIVMLLTDKHVTLDQKNFCKNVDSANPYIKFQYTFKINKKEVIYEYTKNGANTLVQEKFSIENELIFSYDFDKKQKEMNRLDLINAENLNFEFYEGNIAILRYIANNTTQGEDSIIKQLVEFVSGMLWFRSLKDNSFIGLENNSLDYIQWIIKNKKIGKLEKFLKEVANMDIKFDALQLPGEALLLEKHDNGQLPFIQVASSGTIALTLLFFWKETMDEKRVSFLFIDEFDAFYHYELSEKVIELFLKYKEAQVMFTSHNTYIVKNELLRPDCYFLLKDGKISSFADSTDRELREGHNLEKMLRQGEFNG